MKDVFPMKVITHTITHQAKSADGQIESIMYPAKFAGGRSRLDLLLSSFLPSREEKKIQDQKNRPLGCRAQKHTPPKHLGSDEQKIQDQKNHPLGSRGVLHTPHMDRVMTETKMQERRKQSIDSGVEWHTPFMRQGKRDAVWRDTFLEQRARVAIWRDRRLEERSSHARLQLKTFGENSKPYKSSLVALSEQLRDIFAA